MFKKFKLNSLFTLFLTLLIIFAPLYSLYADSTYEWATNFGGTGTNHNNAYSIVVDSSLNSYTTGLFYGTVDFDPGVGVANLSAASGTSPSVFILKLDAEGDYVWAKRVEAISFSSASGAQFIALDSLGNVYITGFFQGTQDFDPGVGSSELTSNGQSDVFILKLNSDGNYVWAKSVGGTLGDGGRAIAFDSSGDLYIAGTFNGTVDFDPGVGTTNLVSTGVTDVFILKLNESNGDYIWAKSVGGTGGDVPSVLAIDSSNNLYAAGYFNGTVDFDPGVGTTNLVSAGSSDGFIFKLGSDGEYVWSKRIGGVDPDYINSLELDDSDFLYITTGSSVAKLDSLGEYIWTKEFEIIADGSELYHYALTLDSSNNVYTVGTFYGTIDFDPSIVVSSLVSGDDTSYDIFISKLDSDGEYVWAGQYLSSIADTFPQPNSIVVDTDDNIYTAGSLYGALDFDPGAGEEILTSRVDYLDMFISKLSQAPSASAPTLTTSPATNTERSTTTLNGEITSTGGVNPTIRGFNYGLDTNYGTNTVENGSFSTGTYTSNLTDLDCNTTYHYRAYATNSVGTSYGGDQTFTTSSCRSSSGSYPRSSPYVSTPQVTTPTIPTQQPTTPTQPSSTSVFNRTLKLTIPRMIGDDVKSLQEFLNSKGYTIPQTSYQIILNLPSPDGIYGPKTKEAVIKFQIDNNLVPDGVFGPKTREVMMGKSD